MLVIPSDQSGLDILEHGHAREDIDALKRTRQAKPDDLMRWHPGDAPALERDLSAARLQMAGDQVEEGGLTCTVRPDDRMLLAFLQRKTDIVDCDEAAEILGQSFGFQNSHRSIPSGQTFSHTLGQPDETLRQHQNNHQQNDAEDRRPVLGVLISESL